MAVPLRQNRRRNPSFLGGRVRRKHIRVASSTYHTHRCRTGCPRTPALPLKRSRRGCPEAARSLTAALRRDIRSAMGIPSAIRWFLYAEAVLFGPFSLHHYLSFTDRKQLKHLTNNRVARARAGNTVHRGARMQSDAVSSARVEGSWRASLERLWRRRGKTPAGEALLSTPAEESLFLSTPGKEMPHR